jgi:hypothetical protein
MLPARDIARCVPAGLRVVTGVMADTSSLWRRVAAVGGAAREDAAGAPASRAW